MGAPLDPAIGDGLRATRVFLRERIAIRLPTARQFLGDDSITIPWSASPVVCTSDSFVVDPPVFPGGDVGTLAVTGVANDLLCSGARPMVLMLNLIVGPRATSDLVDRILDSAARTSAAIGAAIVGGDTKYLPDQPHLDLAIASFGIGSLHWRSRPFTLRDVRTGDIIICTGTIGDHTIAVLSAREGLGFERVITSDCAALCDVVDAAAVSGGDDLVGIRDLTRGGLGGALVDLSEIADCIVELDVNAVPIKTHVRAACEMLGLDPLFLANEGKLLLAVRPDGANRVLTAVRETAHGSDAAVVGVVGALPPGHLGPRVLQRTRQRQLRALIEPAGLPVPRLC